MYRVRITDIDNTLYASHCYGTEVEAQYRYECPMLQWGSEISGMTCVLQWVDDSDQWVDLDSRKI